MSIATGGDENRSRHEQQDEPLDDSGRGTVEEDSDESDGDNQNRLACPCLLHAQIVATASQPRLHQDNHQGHVRFALASNAKHVRDDGRYC